MQACLGELEEALTYLQAEEAAGRAAAPHKSGAVLLLRDKLELYIKTAPPGEAYQAAPADIATAAMAARLLEGRR